MKNPTLATWGWLLTGITEMKVSISEQGELVKVLPNIKRTKYIHSYGRGNRRAITTFTRRSRKNLLDKFATIDKQKAKNATFVTLTYIENFQDHNEAYRHLDLFLKRIQYNYGLDGFFACWKKEPQERGAIHFHLMMWNVKFIDKVRLANMWMEITQQCSHWKTDKDGFDWYNPPFTRIEYCRAQRKAWYYVSKYLGKVSGGFESGFNIATNSEMAQSPEDYHVKRQRHYNPIVEGRFQTDDTHIDRKHKREKRQGVGRYWGWFNRKNIPFADEIVTVVEVTWEEYRRLRWDLLQVFPHAGKSMLCHAFKCYWFYDFISPVMMLLDGMAGGNVLGWKYSERFVRDVR